MPISEDAYARAVDDPAAFRRLLDEGFRTAPELFPPNFARGYALKDERMSVKQGSPIRRILLSDGAAYSIRPSFLMPYMVGRADAVAGPLFLRKFGVPYWALARVFGGDPMYWSRIECGLGRFSVVGATVRRADVPAGLLLANGKFAADSALPADQYLSWGWRLPFLAGVVLLGLGLFIRLHIPESPLFARARAERATRASPLVDLVRNYPRNLLLAMGARFAENACFYVFTVFIYVYASEPRG